MKTVEHKQYLNKLGYFFIFTLFLVSSFAFGIRQGGSFKPLKAEATTTVDDNGNPNHSGGVDVPPLFPPSHPTCTPGDQKHLPRSGDSQCPPGYCAKTGMIGTVCTCGPGC